MAARKVSSKTCTWFGMDHIARARTKACVPLVSSKCMNLTVKNFAVVLASTSTCHLSGKTMAKPTMGHVWTKQFVLEGSIVFFFSTNERRRETVCISWMSKDPISVCFLLGFCVRAIHAHLDLLLLPQYIREYAHDRRRYPLVGALLRRSGSRSLSMFPRMSFFHLSFVFSAWLGLGWYRRWRMMRWFRGSIPRAPPLASTTPHIKEKKRNDGGCWDTRTIKTSSNTP